jgi:hypothetical protein
MALHWIFTPLRYVKTSELFVINHEEKILVRNPIETGH